jgi:hypothetical protein
MLFQMGEVLHVMGSSQGKFIWLPMLHLSNMFQKSSLPGSKVKLGKGGHLYIAFDDSIPEGTVFRLLGAKWQSGELVNRNTFLPIFSQCCTCATLQNVGH